MKLAFDNQGKYALVAFLLSLADWIATAFLLVELYRFAKSPVILALFPFLFFLPPLIVNGLPLRLSNLIEKRKYLAICLFVISILNVGLGLSSVLGVLGILTIFIIRLCYGVVQAFYRPVSKAYAVRISDEGDEADSLFRKQIGETLGFLVSLGIGLAFAKVSESPTMPLLFTGLLTLIAAAVQLQMDSEEENVSKPNQKSIGWFFVEIGKSLQATNMRQGMGFLILVSILGAAIGRLSNYTFLAFLGDSFSASELQETYLSMRLVAVTSFVFALCWILLKKLHLRPGFLKPEWIVVSSISASVVLTILAFFTAKSFLFVAFSSWWVLFNIGGVSVLLRIQKLEIRDNKSGEYFVLESMARSIVPIVVLLGAIIASYLGAQVALSVLGLSGGLAYWLVWRKS